MKKKVGLAILSSVIVISSIFVSNGDNNLIGSEVSSVKAASSGTFKDIGKFDSATISKIENLVGRKVISGFSDGTFRPEKQLTRAEFAAFVARSLELPAATSNFKDVSRSAALYDGISRAYKAGIIKGFADGTFKPNVLVSREDMAVMIDRAMQGKGSFLKKKTLNFSDNSQIGAYAKSSIERLYYYGVMGTYEGTKFKAKTVGTRMETVLSIYSMLEVIEKGVVITEPTPPTQTPDPDKPVFGDKINIKGINFTYNEIGSWVNDYGNSYGTTVPSKQQDFTVGTRNNFRNFPEDKYGPREGMLIFYLITRDMPFTKTEFLEIVKEVGQNKTPKTVKGFYFYPDPNPTFAGDIIFELK